jgi:hypothetical protein
VYVLRVEGLGMRGAFVLACRVKGCIGICIHAYVFVYAYIVDVLFEAILVCV